MGQWCKMCGPPGGIGMCFFCVKKELKKNMIKNQKLGKKTKFKNLPTEVIVNYRDKETGCCTSLFYSNVSVTDVLGELSLGTGVGGYPSIHPEQIISITVIRR